MAKLWKLTCEQCGDPFELILHAGRLPNRCPECRKKDPKGRELQNRRHQEGRNEVRFGATISAFDDKELDYIVEQIGGNKRNAIETSIRVYAAILKNNRRS